MQIIQLGLRRPAGAAPSEADAALIQDILWAHGGCEPGLEHGLEHIRARAGPDLVNLSILLAEAVQDPLGHVLRLIEDVMRNSTYLSGWQIVRRTHPTNEGSGQ
ncbi:hypothetical protein KDL01_15780 [Actinospica durhamensis]|uniref:Uncharacterized protein n=1 Tax=Actinospica durhamensis TaxID=1508375 RepID=A0A941IMX8_9ACTN|nr:hypothetical protein [Actinospica durhamensis]MBR7834735.1 hypothetical protein [Actinospica durhamensis]